MDPTELLHSILTRMVALSEQVQHAQQTKAPDGIPVHVMEDFNRLRADVLADMDTLAAYVRRGEMPDVHIVDVRDTYGDNEDGDKAFAVGG